MKNFRSLLGAVIFAAMAPLSHASIAIPVANAGFEDTPVVWGLSGLASVVGSALPGGQKGLNSNKALQFQNPSDGGGLASASQMVTFPDPANPTDKQFFHYEFWTLSSNSLTIDFTARVLATPSDVFNLRSGNSDSTDPSGWVKWFGDFEFTGLAGDLELEFAIDSQSPFDIRVDNVSLQDCGVASCTAAVDTSNVPEPGSLFLVGAGLAIGGLARRKAAKA